MASFKHNIGWKKTCAWIDYWSFFLSFRSRNMLDHFKPLRSESHTGPQFSASNIRKFYHSAWIDLQLTFSWDLDTFPLFSTSRAVKAYQMDLSSSERKSMTAAILLSVFSFFHCLLFLSLCSSRPPTPTTKVCILQQANHTPCWAKTQSKRNKVHHVLIWT